MKDGKKAMLTAIFLVVSAFAGKTLADPGKAIGVSVPHQLRILSVTWPETRTGESPEVKAHFLMSEKTFDNFDMNRFSLNLTWIDETTGKTNTVHGQRLAWYLGPDATVPDEARDLLHPGFMSDSIKPIRSVQPIYFTPGYVGSEVGEAADYDPADKLRLAWFRRQT